MNIYNYYVISYNYTVAKTKLCNLHCVVNKPNITHIITTVSMYHTYTNHIDVVIADTTICLVQDVRHNLKRPNTLDPLWLYTHSPKRRYKGSQKALLNAGITQRDIAVMEVLVSFYIPF